jgi:protein O-mannosyl-transferase
MPSPRAHLPTLLLVLTALVAYLPAFSAGFIWDDPDYVLSNPNLRDLPGLLRTWTDPTSLPQWYPLVHTTYFLEYQLWGLWSPGYHAVNILLHALGAILLHRLLLRLELPPAVALISALLWSLHPVQVESVAWVTERKNTLSFVFYMLAALALLREPHTLLLPLLFYTAALLSKTVTASLPAAYLLLVYYRNARITRADIAFTLPLFAVGAVMGLFTAYLERYHVGAFGPEWAFTPLDRCLIAGRAVVFYLHCLLYPVNLAFIYERWTINAALWWQYLFPASVVLGLLTLFLLRHRIGRGPFVALAFFVGTLIPALGFFNVYPHRYSFVADHFQHIASVGPLVLLGFLLARCPRFVPAAVLVVLGALTLLQTRVYRDELTLWTDTLAKNPNSWMVHVNLGITHDKLQAAARNPADQISHEQRAYDHMLTARRLAPHLPETHWNAGVAHANRGEFDAARTAFADALALDKDYVPALNSLALVELRQSNPAAAQRLLQHAVSVQPGFARAHFHLAQALRAQNQLDRAARQYGQALLLDPSQLQWRLDLARLLRDMALASPDPARRSELLGYSAGHLQDAVRLNSHPALRREFEDTVRQYQASKTSPP